MKDNWALFLGMLMLMVANGILSTLPTIRGNALGFSDFTIGLMQAGYPVGALFGAILAPKMVERVGHIRAFSAMASTASIAAIIHLLTGDPISWGGMGFLAGFCFPGLYVITESWLNAKSSNKIRAQILSIYFIIQLAGPALGTLIVGFPDPSGNLLFGLVSVLISLSIVPLLLSTNKAPEYVAPERMSLRGLYHISPMAVLGIVLMNVAVAAWYVSLPLYALQRGFSAAEASGALAVALIAGALVQYPVGWLSDHMDRRNVLVALGAFGVATSVSLAIDQSTSSLVIGFAVIAATTLPAYSICVAHANDQLKPGQIVPASGTMVFLLNTGMVVGILLGPNTLRFADGRGLPILLGVFTGAVALVALVRRVKEAAPEETGTLQAIGVIGVPNAGMLQAESLIAKKEEVPDSFELEQDSPVI